MCLGACKSDDSVAACEGDVIVFFEPGTPTTELDAVASGLAHEDEVESIAVWDQAMTFDEFEGLFATQPEILAAVSPEILPPSVRLRTSSADAAASLASRFEPRDDVREVLVDPSSPEHHDPDNPYSTPISCDRGFPQVGRIPMTTLADTQE